MLPYFEISKYDFYVIRWSEPLNWPAHLHPEIEIVYIRKGALETSIDAQKKRMYEGDVAIIFPNCVHSYQVVPEFEKDTDILLYLFNRQMAGDYTDKINTCFPQVPFVDKGQMREDAYNALDHLLLQWENFHPSIAKAYLQIILACAWETIKPDRDITRHQEITFQVLKYLSENFKNPISVESTAKELCISKNYLSRIFTRKLHMTFHQYLHFMRVEVALDLLRNTDRSITDILFECGYKSSRTFNRAFQEVCGMTPRQYRSQFRDMEPKNTERLLKE